MSYHTVKCTNNSFSGILNRCSPAAKKKKQTYLRETLLFLLSAKDRSAKCICYDMQSPNDPNAEWRPTIK